jgi:hypothetical protein
MNSNKSRARRERRIAFLQADECATKVSGQQTAQAPTPDWHQRLTAFPDPWLFDSEKLLGELDRCRELVMAIPDNADRHATHFQREIAITALWNLRQTLRHLLHVHREGQRQFAKKTASTARIAQISNLDKRRA